MEKPRPILHLITSINKKRYVLGTLRFNKNELSYFFTYPSDSPQQHYNCETGGLTPALDHITWHQNRVHIKRKDDVVVDPIYYEGGPLLSKSPAITPLYVESLFFEGDPCLIGEDDFPRWKGSQSQELLSLDPSKGFSVIFMLVPARMPMLNILAGFQFEVTPAGFLHPPCLLDLCDMDHKPKRILVWEGWDLVVITSRYVRNVIDPIPSEVGKNFRIPDYKNTRAALTDLMLQSLKS